MDDTAPNQEMSVYDLAESLGDETEGETEEVEVTEGDELDESTESEPDEGETEEGDEEESTGEKLVIDGEEFEVPEALAPMAKKLKGLEQSLRADHTRKTQEASEIRKQATQFYEQTKQTAVFQQENVGMLAEYVATNNELKAYENVDWANLDEWTYRTHKENQTKLREKASELANSLNQRDSVMQQQRQAEDSQKWQQTVEAVRRAIPEYNETTDQKAVQAAVSLGKKYGFDVDIKTLSQMRDPLVWIGLVELAKYQDLVAKRPEISKKVAAAPKMGKPSAPAKSSRTNEATKRLKQSGRVEDLAKFL